MDSVYGHYNRLASAKINIKKYFSEFSNSLYQFDQANSPTDSIFQIMKADLCNGEMSMLSEYCSLQKLTVSDEVPKINGNLPVRCKDLINVSATLEDSNLETLQHLKNRNKLTDQIRLKFTSELLIDYEKIKYDENSDVLAIPHEDILVYVRVYESFPHSSSGINPNHRSSKPILRNVIEILGKQMLTDLRDKITCLSDLTIPVEISENPKQPLKPMAKDVYKSGFFYIENTFYNDFRDQENLDYSAVIREWAKLKQLGPFSTACMEDVRIDSLHVKFGYPWVYQHQGSCEHLIIFSDARLLSPDDELRVSAYPRIHKIKPQRGHYCYMCGVLPVKWIVKDHPKVPHNPSFFCENCFHLYNYANGKKLGNFKAYHYPCDTTLLHENEEIT